MAQWDSKHYTICAAKYGSHVNGLLTGNCRNLSCCTKVATEKDCGIYRTIALISHTSKILLIIILNRLKSKIEQELSDCQAGYRANRGTTDMLFTLQIIIEQIRNSEDQAFITFIDYSKAFDCVNHEEMVETLKSFNCHYKLVNLIANLYLEQQAAVL